MANIIKNYPMELEPDMNRLVETYGDGLLRLCLLYLKDMHLAEDALQDTFLQVYRHYHSFQGQAAEKTWITRIAINVCKNYLRKPWRRRMDPEAALEQIPAPEPEDPDDTVLLAVMNLPPKYKDVILLYYYREMTTEEIARVLGISQSAVWVRLKRARDRLKTQLKGWYFDE